MESRLKFLPRSDHRLTSQQGHRNEGQAALWMAVQPRRRKPRRECEECGATQFPSFLESTCKKSFCWESERRPYRKPTQVGKASSLR